MQKNLFVRAFLDGKPIKGFENYLITYPCVDNLSEILSEAEDVAAVLIEHKVGDKSKVEGADIFLYDEDTLLSHQVYTRGKNCGERCYLEYRRDTNYKAYRKREYIQFVGEEKYKADIEMINSYLADLVNTKRR
ncbi:MAG: hypothetical protein NC120_05185 [Ruminococcus sp.]|nr:hypothetical protein [Ruminococcus sp.]